MVTGEWGEQVLVRAEAVRVIVEPVDGVHRYKQAASERDFGRFVRHDFSSCTMWPGAPIDGIWEPHTDTFDPDPTPNGKVLARVRRLEFAKPRTGLIVGWARRSEGRITGAGGRNSLDAGRSMQLLEIALAVNAGDKAAIVLAHPHDVAVVPALLR